MDIPRSWAGLRGLLVCALAVAMVAVAPRAAAEEDPPGRVGRLSEMQGAVSWFDHETGAWAEAERNRPLTVGDRLSTGPDSRAELRVGSSVLRLGSGSEFEVLELDEQRMVFQLHAGKLALRVRSREVASEIEIVTAEARFAPQRSGHYRFDRIDDSTFAGAWRGELRIDDPQGFLIASGQRVEVYRERRGPNIRELRSTWVAMPVDAFGDWVARDDRRDDERSASQRYVSPEMTGAEELDHHGQWSRHPEYGAIWYPTTVTTGWAPYRYGRWVWVRPWGWTWVDEAPWGFAPFHYGRWVWWGSRWGWVPGAYVARPVYAPALVAWVGGPNWNVSVNIGGGPAVGWVPLAPREVYVPWYRHRPGYVDRVHPPGWRPPQRAVPTGPIMYSNQGVPNAVTVVPRDVLVQRRPVGRAVVTLPPEQVRAPVMVGQPPVWQGANGRSERGDRNDRGDRGDRGDRRDGRDGRVVQVPQVVSPPPQQLQSPAQPQPVAPAVQPAPQIVVPAPQGGVPQMAPQFPRDGPRAPAGSQRGRDGEPHGEVIDLRRARPPQAAAPAPQAVPQPAPQPAPQSAPQSAPPVAPSLRAVPHLQPPPAPVQVAPPPRPQAPPPQVAAPQRAPQQADDGERKRIPEQRSDRQGRGERER